jgi:branched-chain amino acid transport system permease protein
VFGVSSEAYGSAIVAGLATGSVYALIAFGYVLVFRTTNVFNFAQGDLVMAGAVVGYALYVSSGIPAAAALVLVLAVLALVGAVQERVAIWPVARAGGTLGWLVTTLAFGITLRNAVQLTWGTTARSFPSPVGGNIAVIGLHISSAQLTAVVAAFLVAAGLEIFHGRTLFGKAMLAIAEDREAASVRGLNVALAGTLSFALAAAVSGLAGFVVAPSTFVSAQMGVNLGLKAFVAMAIGGFESNRGALVGGLLFGLVESLSGLFVDSVYVDFIGLGLLVTVLVIFPRGIFGGRGLRTV